MRDSEQSVALPYTTRLSGQAFSGERQGAVSGNALDHSAIRAGPTRARDRELSVPTLWTTRLSGQALQGRGTESCQCLHFGPLGYQGRPYKGEGQRAVSAYTLDHSAIRAGPTRARDRELSVPTLWTTRLSGQALQGRGTESCQCLHFGPLGYQGRPYKGEGLRAVSAYTLDHSAIRAGPTRARDRELSVPTLWTTRLSGQTLQGRGTESCQCLHFGPLGYQGRPYKGEGQRAVSAYTLDHSAIRAGPTRARDRELSVPTL